MQNSEQKSGRRRFLTMQIIVRNDLTPTFGGYPPILGPFLGQRIRGPCVTQGAIPVLFYPDLQKPPPKSTFQTYKINGRATGKQYFFRAKNRLHTENRQKTTKSQNLTIRPPKYRRTLGVYEIHDIIKNHQKTTQNHQK